MTADQRAHRHSWIVIRHFMSLTGKPMEALRCRFCDAHKNRRLGAKKS